MSNLIEKVDEILAESYFKDPFIIPVKENENVQGQREEPHKQARVRFSKHFTRFLSPAKKELREIEKKIAVKNKKTLYRKEDFENFLETEKERLRNPTDENLRELKRKHPEFIKIYLDILKNLLTHTYLQSNIRNLQYKTRAPYLRWTDDDAEPEVSGTHDEAEPDVSSSATGNKNSISYFSERAALLAADKYFHQHLLEDQRTKLPNHVFPVAWIERVLRKHGKKLSKIENNAALKEIYEVAKSLMVNLAKYVEENDRECNVLKKWATMPEEEAPCYWAAFSDWSNSIFMKTRNTEDTSLPRYLCKSFWPQLACPIVREQLRDWLSFACGIETEKEITARSLVMAAHAAVPVSSLMGERFEFLAPMLIDV